MPEDPAELVEEVVLDATELGADCDSVDDPELELLEGVEEDDPAVVPVEVDLE